MHYSFLQQAPASRNNPKKTQADTGSRTGSRSNPAGRCGEEEPNQVDTSGAEAARKLYGYHCAMLHGKEGDGKGDLAGQMKLDLRDWRDPNSISKYTDGELFYIITMGAERWSAEKATAQQKRCAGTL